MRLSSACLQSGSSGSRLDILALWVVRGLQNNLLLRKESIMSAEVGKYHVESNNETDTPKFPESQIRSVAERLWWHKAPKKTIAKYTHLTEEQVEELQKTREYREYVEQIMFERFLADDFEAWVGRPGNMKDFDERMELDPEVVQDMVARVRQKHTQTMRWS